MQPENQPQTPAPQAPQAPAAPAPQAPAEPAPVAPEYVPGIQTASYAQPETPPAPQNPQAPQQPAPQAPAAPETPPAPQTLQAPAFESYDKYLESFIKQPENLPDVPSPKNVPTDDNGEALEKFFLDYGQKIEDRAYQRAMADFQSHTNFRETEKSLWDKAISEYDVIGQNETVRQMVHAVRVAEYNKGNPATPLEAAKIVIGEIQKANQAAVEGAQTTTQTLNQQPAYGGGTPPAPQTLTRESLTSLHVPGSEGVDAAAALIQRAMDRGEI